MNTFCDLLLKFMSLTVIYDNFILKAKSWSLTIQILYTTHTEKQLFIPCISANFIFEIDDIEHYT